MSTVRGENINLDAQLLKRLSRMFEAGMSVAEIAAESGTDAGSVRRLLKLLGYRTAD